MPRDALANPVVLAALGALLERPMHAYQLATVLAGRGVPANRPTAGSGAGQRSQIAEF